MFRVNEDTCRFKPRSSKLAWRSSRVPQIVCGSHPLRCGRTVRSMSHGFFLAASTFMDRNNKINKYVVEHEVCSPESHIGRKGFTTNR